MSSQSDQPLWNATGASKREAVRDLFGQISSNYDRVNGLMSAGLHRSWRAKAVAMLELRPGDRALDLCCGTGDFLPPLRKAVGVDGTLLGVDFCLPMLQHASAKDSEATLSVGDACALPVSSCSVDAVTVGWGIRNVPDIDQAHREIARVLKSGGRFVSIDMATPRNPVVRAMSGFVQDRFLPWIGGMFGHRDAYRYLNESAKRFWDRERLAESMRQAGMTDVRHSDLFFGVVCIHFGRKPEAPCM